MGVPYRGNQSLFCFMTLTALLEAHKIEIPHKEKTSIGARIAAKYLRRFTVAPIKISENVNGFKIYVVDYPEEWMKTSGFKVVQNYLKIQTAK